MSETEWTEALRCFRTALPLSFRINRHSFRSDSIQQHLLDSLFDAVPPGALSAVPCAPNQYVASIPSRFWSDRARKVLADAQELGGLHRQEVVSALPALLLGIKPHHAVLDLAAAPGSKTLQMLDMMHQNEGDDPVSDDSISSPTGLLVANDPARNRLLSLTRRSRRQRRSPLITSASDGRYFPTLRKALGYKCKFDRVLCDAPCSGDGTLRKASSKEWKEWTVKNGITLHKLQTRLLIRALKAVKRGGRVLYSTCSLNPIENEAVVMEAIHRCSNETDAYRILPLPEKFEGAEEEWRHSPGSTCWVVPDPKFEAESNPIVYRSYDDVPAGRRKGKGALLHSMFCPKARKNALAHSAAGDDGNNYDHLSEELATELEVTLPNTARILPHHLDSGGFFCALIERKEATFYAVCLDKAESACTSSDLNGKIFLRVETARQVRDVIRATAADGSNNTRHLYEGFPSLQLAQAWLRKNGAYVVGISDEACELPDLSVHAPVGSEEEHKRKRARYGCAPKAAANSDTTGSDKVEATLPDEKDSPTYSPIFKMPHPSLVAAFCDFYGLDSTLFPAESIRIIGGGADADKVTSFGIASAPDNSRATDGTNNSKRKIKYMQLTLMSPTLSRLNAGGATFTPIESGIGLCFVPNLHPSSQLADAGIHLDEKEKRRGGKFDLLDEAAEIVGRHASKRIIALSTNQAANLLSSLKIDLPIDNDNNAEPGGMIAVCTIEKKQRISDSAESPTLVFLSCTLVDGEKAAGGKVLKLLADSTLAESMYRAVVEN